MTALDLLDILDAHEDLAALDPPRRRLALRNALAGSVPDCELGRAVANLADEIDAYGPVTNVMSDPYVTDVLINAPDQVWIERHGTLERTDLRFNDAAHLESFTGRLLLRSGGRADMSAPICDARLPDGTRLHVVVPPVSEGPTISLRKFPATALTLDDLRAGKMMTAAQADLLRDAVVERQTICISGSTGSGKTTLLNALLDLVPATQRVVIVEQARELRPACGHALTLATVGTNQEGRSGVDLDGLVRAALRMRPDRLVVGEVRGPEALPALNALSTGHPGSMLTVHAGSAREALVRIAQLAAFAANSPADVFTARVTSAIDLVVQLQRIEGLRAVAEIFEP
ncbi:MAG: CpaF family protein [Actinomycetota bacterium]